MNVIGLLILFVGGVVICCGVLNLATFIASDNKMHLDIKTPDEAIKWYNETRDL